MKKHKRHKSDKGERNDDSQPSLGGDKPPALKLILKVGGNMSTPEHSNDSLGPPNSLTNFGTPVSSSYGVGSHEDESMSLQSMSSVAHGERHNKKMKKKKKKKEKDKSKDKHEKKHKHRHKDKRKRVHEPPTVEDANISEEALLEPPKKPLIEITPAPTPPKIESAVTSPPKPVSPVRPPVSPRTEAREQRSCVIRLKQEHTPFLKFLDYMLKLLEKKDPQQFFAWPVTDSFAPGYSNIITQPMDFSTITQKIEDHLYNTLSEFVDDFKLMCTNAMTYNHQDTIYYKAAKKLLHQGLKLLSEEKIKPLTVVLPYLNDITADQLGFQIGPEVETEEEHMDEDVENKVEEAPKGPRELPKTKFEAIQDDLTPDQILKQAQAAAKEAAKKVSEKRAGCMGSLRQDKDGYTSLNILVPNDGVTPGTNERPVLLGALIGKLQHGSGQLQGFKEDRRNMCKPVKPLYYGTFGSYAPSYDSTFANLTKEESDLIYQTYGDETSVQYAESILDFAKDCDYALTMVDNLLDLMTGGDHRRTKKVLEERRRLREEEERIKQLMEPAISNSQSVNVDFASLRTLSELGIETKFLDAFENKPAETEQNYDEVQNRLNETTSLIQKLHRVQTDRLSQMPPPHLSHIPGPSEAEFDLADKIADAITDISKRLSPEAITPTSGVRKALGVAAIVQEPAVPDLESELREFLESESALGVDHSPLHDDKTIEEILSVSES